MGADAIFAALARYKGVDLNHPNVEDMREIQEEAMEFGMNLSFEEIRSELEKAGKLVADGMKKRHDEKK